MPLRVVATVKLCEGLAWRKRVTREQQEVESFSAGDVSSLTLSQSTATIMLESQATDSLFDFTSEGTKIELTSKIYWKEKESKIKLFSSRYK